VAKLTQLQTEVGTRLRRGDSLSSVEDEVIEPSGLSEEHKSALWLYGWSYVEAGRRRYEQRQQQIRRQAGQLRPVVGTE
jgi:hypothetical protein